MLAILWYFHFCEELNVNKIPATYQGNISFFIRGQAPVSEGGGIDFEGP